MPAQLRGTSDDPISTRLRQSLSLDNYDANREALVMKPHTMIALPYIACGMMLVPYVVAYAHWMRIK